MADPARRPTPANERRVPLVLVVDDYEDIRVLYAEYLHAAGFRTECAEDGAIAIARAHALRPDLIVMDLDMPNLDGREAIRQLKADPATRDIVIIALTGREVMDHGQRVYEVGCDEYLTKPLSPDALAAAVRTALACRYELGTGSRPRLR
jgi:CheY-like chemotaxis protein